MDRRSVARALRGGPRYIAKKGFIKALGVGARYRKKRFADLCARGTVGGADVWGSWSPTGLKRSAFAAREELARPAIEQADRFISGEMLLFGRLVTFREKDEEEYPWHRDFINGVSYEPTLYTHVARPGQDEIKVPWEFGRMHAAVHLALAWRETKRDEYGNELRALVRSFARENPVGFGVQWVCAMEVGIRIFNVLQAYAIIADLLDPCDDLHRFVPQLAWEHGEFLYANLETDARLYENNHYVADLLGLAAIGTMMPDLDRSHRWRDYARGELERVVRKQVLLDGTAFEGSVRYARLIWELFAFSGLLYRRNGVEMSEQYWQKLADLAQFLRWMTPPSGTSIQIGDNDSGRALFLTEQSYADLRYAKHAVDGVFPDDAVPDAFLFAGIGSSDEGTGCAQGLRVFSDGRLAVYRDRQVFLCLSATDPHRFDVPGHAHGDKLSIALEWRGRPFIVDAGTGDYTRDLALRDALRSVAAHSTIQVGGEEQNEFEGVFWSRPNGKTSIGGGISPDEIVLEGQHDCYRERFGIVHRRRVVCRPDALEVVIEDALDGWVPGMEAAIRFVLDPRVEVVSLEGNFVQLRYGDAALSLTCSGNISVEDGLFSPEYSHVLDTRVLVCSVVADCFTTLIDLVG